MWIMNRIAGLFIDFIGFVITALFIPLAVLLGTITEYFWRFLKWLFYKVTDVISYLLLKIWAGLKLLATKIRM